MPGRRWLRPLLLLLLACRALQPALGQDNGNSFEERIASLLERPRHRSAFWGVHIARLDNRETLFAHNAGKRFQPASNMKLLVAAAALDLWGPDHRFRTPVFLEGILDDQGRAIGNLVLAGRGDPNPERRLYDPKEKNLPIRGSSPFIEGIADQLEERGIRRVEGDIVADTTFFLDEPYGGDWEQEDMFWHYGAPSSALAVFENVFRVSLSPGKAGGDPALLEVTPPQDTPEVVSRVGTVRSGGKPDIRIAADRSGSRVTLQGSLPLNRPTLTYALAVSEPALTAARYLKTSLERRGIPVSGQPRVRALEPIEVLENREISLERVRERQFAYREEQELASWRSLPLIDNLRILIKSSRNLYGEMLLRGLGAEATGVGSLETGLQVLEAFLEKAGIADEPLDFSDGSGLSRTNLLTPESVVRLLQYMERHPQAAGFRDCLPIAGRDGTLKNRMKGTAAQGRVLAKTGTLKFVSSLSGYATSLDGTRMAFSIMANNTRGSPRGTRRAIDAICALMAGSRWKEPAAGGGSQERP
jgi:D-alanyl-D-alanine carboxypeptidase/D-alanyl-D-alanine-endopeptidase (penicillin-binding protein 4)